MFPGTDECVAVAMCACTTPVSKAIGVDPLPSLRDQ
jgi:hypothetical protein